MVQAGSFKLCPVRHDGNRGLHAMVLTALRPGAQLLVPEVVHGIAFALYTETVHKSRLCNITFRLSRSPQHVFDAALLSWMFQFLKLEPSTILKKQGGGSVQRYGTHSVGTVKLIRDRCPLTHSSFFTFNLTP